MHNNNFRETVLSSSSSGQTSLDYIKIPHASELDLIDQSSEQYSFSPMQVCPQHSLSNNSSNSCIKLTSAATSLLAQVKDDEDDLEEDIPVSKANAKKDEEVVNEVDTEKDVPSWDELLNLEESEDEYEVENGGKEVDNKDKEDKQKEELENENMQIRSDKASEMMSSITDDMSMASFIEQNLNECCDDIVNKAKEKMDNTFFKNQIGESSTNFIYDKRKSFQQTEICDWDESDNEKELNFEN